MTVKIKPDQVYVNGTPVAADLGDALVVEDDDGNLWALIAVRAIHVVIDDDDHEVTPS